MEYQSAMPKKWMKGVLFIAAIISLVSGVQYLVFPDLIFSLGNLTTPNYSFLWQTLGAMSIVFGIVLFIAATNPYRHWASVLLVFLSKIAASILFVFYTFQQPELWGLSNYIYIDNLLWILPLGAVLVGVYKKISYTDDLLIDLYSRGYSDFTLDLFETSSGENLLESSNKQPVMLLFLRHFGCTFCRESMQDIAEHKEEIENSGTKIIVVHMMENEDLAYEQMQKYGIETLDSISDPECILYKMFKLKNGNFMQLFGPKVIFRGIFAAIFKGFGLGKEMGDMKQMPGVFIVHNGKVKRKFIHKSAADRPNYLELATFE